MSSELKLYSSSKFDVVVCTHCALAYLNPRMTQDEYSKYYSDEYQKNRHSITTFDEAITRLKVKKSYERKKELLPVLEKFIRKDSNVLEVGSGWGTLLKFIQDTFGSKVKGLEISSLAAQVSREYYGIPTEEKTLEGFCGEQKSSEQKFDFVIMYHVLEHILDPVQALQILKNVIADNGVLYIAVPNLAHPDEDISLFFRVEHCFYFTPNTLVAMLQKSGYVVIDTIITAKDIQVVAQKDGRVKSVQEGVRLGRAPSARSLVWIVRKARMIEGIKVLFRPVKKIIQSWLR